MSLPVAILAGGLATRLRPLTERVPKILLEMAGRPFAEHQIELLRRGGIDRIVYCLGYLGGRVVDALGDGSRWQMTFTYVFDGERPLGTGGALQRALPELGLAFFVMYGDSYLECNLADVERSFRESGKPGLMTVFRNENRWGQSNVRYEQGRIVRYEKSGDDPEMRHIDYGLSILTPGALDGSGSTPDVKREPATHGRDFPGPSTGSGAAGSDALQAFDLASVYQGLIARDALAGYEVSERFYEIGSLEGLEDLRGKLEARATTRSRTGTQS